MDYSEFKDSVETLLINKNLSCQYWEKPLPDNNSQYFYRSKTKEPVNMNGLLVEWETGGVEGGNCWESSNPQSYTSDEPPAELTSIDAVMEEMCPSITYLAFRRLEKLIKSGDYTHTEYYGNETSYSFKYLPLEEFYNFLSDERLLDKTASLKSSP